MSFFSFSIVSPSYFSFPLGCKLYTCSGTQVWPPWLFTLLWYAGKLHLPTNRWINCDLIWKLRDLAFVLSVRNEQPRSTIRKHRSQTCCGLLYRKRFMRSNFLQTTDTRSSIRHKSSPPLDTNSSTTNSLDKLSSTNAPVIALAHEQRRSYVICLRVCYWLL